LIPSTALAGIDPKALKALPVEGDVNGGTTRLRQLEAATQESVLVDKPWEESSDGVSYREYKEGRGDAGMSFLSYMKRLRNP
jgi:hypothetical protein